MELAANALVELEDARDYVKRKVSDDSGDSKLILLINSYSTAIQKHIKRQLKPRETGATKLFQYDGNGILDLRGTELASAPTSLVIHSDLPAADRITLQAGSSTQEADYRLEPRNKTSEGTYLWLVLPRIRIAPIDSLSNPTDPRVKLSEVAITGDWGADVVPADVAHACLIAVKAAYVNPEGFPQRDIGALHIIDGSSSDGGSLPLGSLRLLRPYRSPTVA